MSLPVEFEVSVINIGGGNAGVPRVEWMCLQSRFCSYAPPSLVENIFSTSSEFPNYNSYTEELADITRSFKLNVAKLRAHYAQQYFFTIIMFKVKRWLVLSDQK